MKDEEEQRQTLSEKQRFNLIFTWNMTERVNLRIASKIKEKLDRVHQKIRNKLKGYY